MSNGVPAGVAAELTLFGAPRIVRDDGPVHVGARKALLLLALLALEGPLPRDGLAARLWPEVDAAAARRNLRRELFRLRERGCAPAEGADGALAVPPSLRVDVHAFHAALAAGDDRAALRRAGPRVLDGLDGSASPDIDAWIVRWRERLQRERASARNRLAERLQAQGDLAGALGCYREALFEDPCDEAAARQAMRLHAAVGDHAATAQLYRRLVAALRDELDAAPSPSTLDAARELGLDGSAEAGRPAPPRPPVAAGPGSLPFVGRRDERARILAAWRAGRGVYLSGLPGSGKTRLLNVCAAAGGAWLRLACSPFDRALPFGLAVRALRTLREADRSVTLPQWVARELARLLPELGETAPPPGEASTERLARAYAEAWQRLAHDNFATVLFDDWQWCDDDSAALLDPVLESAAVAHARVFRTAQLGRDAVQRLRHAVEAGRAVHVELEGLAPSETAALAAAAAPGQLGSDPALFVAELHDATEGNPFYVIETLRALQASGAPAGPAALVMPATVRAAVLDRVDAAGDAARRLLEAACLLPEPFEPALLDAVTPIGADAVVALLEAAEQARLIERDDRSYRFTHDLVRDSLQAGLSPARRALLHERLAQRLQQHGAGAALVAAQWEGAGRAEQALAWRLRAADEALQLHALADAEQHYRSALADGPSAPQQAAIQLGLADIHRHRGRPDAADGAFADAIAAARQADAQTLVATWLARIESWVQTDRLAEAQSQLDALAPLVDASTPVQRSRWLELRAIVLANRGDFAAARALHDEAIAGIEGHAEALALRQRLLHEAARLAHMSGDGARALGLADAALACAETLGDAFAIGSALIMQGMILCGRDGHRGRAREAFERARVVARRSAHVPLERRALRQLIHLLIDAGSLDEAEQLVDEGLSLAPWFEHPRAELDHLQTRFVLHVLRGEVDAARAVAALVFAKLPSQTNPMYRRAVREHMVDLYLHTADLATAAALLEDADAQTAPGDFLHTELEAKRAWLELARGDARGARRRLQALAPAATPEARALVAAIAAAAALAQGDAAGAAGSLAAADIDAEMPRKVLAMLLVQRLRLAAACGQPDAAASRRAAALLASPGVPALEARLLREAVASFRRCWPS